jgi:RNA polymerase sigma factor (sigma-70 family)
LKTWVDQLVREYSRGKKQLEKYKDTLDSSNPEQKEECEVVSGMISEMRFSIEWMRSGRRPGTIRGVDIHDAYRVSSLRDMDLFPTLDLQTDQPSLSNQEKKKIVDILLQLSTRERECYLLHRAHGLSIRQIADELGISKRSVQTHVKRADNKIKGIKKN